jgi:aminoglycoside phosphotransferase (APT) family kinase protein
MIEQHRALLLSRFPDLDVQTMEVIGDGWDTFSYLVNGDHVAQFARPTGEPAVTLDRLLVMLPEIAAEVSAPVPLPRFGSAEDPACIVYPLIPGVPMDTAADGIWPERLGRFLYDLHLMPPEYVGLRPRPVDAVRSERRADAAEKMAATGSLLEPGLRRALDGLLASFLDDDANWRFATCLTHGDIAPEHVLIGDDGDLAGVIDWGDTEVGDPAADFAYVLGARPDEGPRALGAYGGEPDAGFLVRADARFCLRPWSDVDYGHRIGDDEILQRGLDGLRDRLA